MKASPELLQFLASLVAILALAGIARWLELGGRPRLDDDHSVGRAAGEAVFGYEPVEIARDHYGRGAIMRDADGRMLLLKPHGNRFAGRMLTPGARARIWRDPGKASLEVDCGERRFGTVQLEIEQPEAWAEAINRLGSAGNA